MSFISRNIRSISVAGKGSGAGSGIRWFYRTTDSLTFVASANYFLPFADALSVGDTIHVVQYTNLDTPSETFYDSTTLQVRASSTTSVTTASYGGGGGASSGGGVLAVSDTDILSESDLNNTLVNTGAPGAVTVTLPPAVEGLLVFATKIEDYTFRLTPDGTDYVRGGNAGGYIELVEGTIVLECIEDSVWEVVGQSHDSGWALQNALDSRTYARRVELDEFRSRYAEPGEKIVWPAFASSLSLSDATNHLTQTQRRKNWRIFMEACLFANGGTGAYNGTGWYSWDSPLTTSNSSAAGTLFIPGPLMIEPYNDSQYAPNWTSDSAGSRFWTIPGAITIEGNGATQGDEGTPGWNEINTKASRIICWDNYVGWWPKGGPASTVSGYQNVSNWKLDRIGVMRKGTIAGPVLLARNWTSNDTGPIVHVCQFWHIGEVVVDMQPEADAVENTGFECRCGLTCQVDYLRIMGHKNAGWGLIYTGNYLIGGGLQATSTSVIWDHLVVKGSGKGIGVADAFFYAGLVNLEQSASETTPTQRLVICEGGDDVNIKELWTENLRPVASGHEAIVVVGQTTADGITEGIIPAGVTSTSANQHLVNIDWSLLGANSGTPIDYGIKVLNGFVRLGHSRIASCTTAFHLAPRLDDTYASIEYDSRVLRTSSVTNIATQTSFGTYPTGYGIRDRGNLPYAPVWMALDVDEPINNKSWGSRYWNKGLGANSAHRLPVAADTDIGKRVTFMLYDNTYTFSVACANGIVISNATQGAVCRITATAHGFSSGQRKWIHYIVGMTELNERYFYISVIDANTVDLYTDAGLSVGVNSTGYTAYGSGGRLGGQKIGAGLVAATTTILERLIPVTFEYLGEDRYAVIDGFEAL